MGLKAGGLADAKQQRNEDLLVAYDRIVKKLGTQACIMTRKSLIHLTVNSPAPRHYITVEAAARYINNVERRGVGAMGVNPLINKQYESVYRHYLRLAIELRGVHKSEIIEKAILMPAECFYMDPSSAKLLLWKLSKGKKKNMKL